MKIGIGGASSSGKSQLAKQIKSAFEPEKSLILELDNYVLPEEQLPKIRDRINWESPSTIDWESVKLDVGKSKFDNTIIEGIFAFAHEELMKQYDHKIFIEISKSTFLERRKLETRWGEEPDWYLEHVWKNHMNSGIPKPFDASYLLLDGTSQFDISEIVKKMR